MEPKRFWLGFVIVLANSASLAFGQGYAPNAAYRKPSEKDVKALISQLGSTDFKVRERASQALKHMDAELPLLQKARAGADLETARRLEVIIAGIENRLAEQFIQQALARINEEGIDLFIDRMVLQKGYATDARWQAGVEIARALVKRAALVGANPPATLDQDFLKLPVATNLDERAGPPMRLLIQGCDKRARIVRGSLLFSSNSLEDTGLANGCVIFVNGDIKALTLPQNCVIFCNGTIQRCSSVRNCVLFCNGVIENLGITESSAIFVRGEIRNLGITRNCVIAATQLTRGGITENNTFLNRDSLPGASSKGDRFANADPSPLTLFEYFDAAKSGLCFSMVDGDARVDSVALGKPFAKSGLTKGDFILAVDRTKFLTQDVFLTLLRRRVVAGQALLKVQRGDRVLEIPVSFAQ